VGEIMKVFKVVIILILLKISLFSYEITTDQLKNNTYSIKIGVFKNPNSIKKLKKRYKKYPYIIHKIKGRNHFFIANISTLKKAKKILKHVKKIDKTAYIKKIRLKKRVIKKVKPIKINTPPQALKTELPKTKTKPKTTIQKALPPKKEQKISIRKKTKSKILTPKSKNHGFSLQEAVLTSLNRSKNILSLREKVIQAKRKVDQKDAAFRPNITLYSTAGVNYNKIRAKKKEEYKYPNGDIQLSITENLYAGGKHINEYKKEIETLKSVTAKFRSKVEEETIKIIKSYLDLVYGKKIIHTYRKNIEKLNEILNIVSIKESAGASSKGDLNYIKSNVENANSALVKEESKYQNAISYYEYFVGKSTQNNRPIEEKFSFDIEDKDEIIKTLQNNNAKLLISKYKLEAQKYDLQSRKSKFRPTVDFIITGKEKLADSELDPTREEKASAVLSLNYNLYNGGKDKAALLESKSKIAELKYKYYDMLEGLKFNTIQIYENISSLKETLKHTKKEVTANRKVVTSYWDAFKYGNQDIQALLLAQRALERSQIDQLKNQKDFIVTHFKLYSEIGTLLKHLNIEDFVNPNKIVQKNFQ
jgi:outer membrane protein TolC